MTARANVANAETQLGLARRALSYALVFSPIDGYVAERNADLGEYVSPTTKVATIVRINPLRIRIDIPEQAIPEVRVGQSVSVTTSAWPDKNFSGRIARISPNVTPSSRTLSVEAEIENSSGAAKAWPVRDCAHSAVAFAAGGADSCARCADRVRSESRILLSRTDMRSRGWSNWGRRKATWWRSRAALLLANR